jgi:RNA polymerase sigma factor (sigma-70 family)
VTQTAGIDLERLGRQWRPALIAFFMRRVRNHAEAEDLTQEVFVRILDGARDVSNPEAFIFEIARNLINDHLRKAKVREIYRATLAGDDNRGLDVLDPHAVASGRETIATFIQALQDLPEKTRSIYVLYRFESMHQDVIGHSFGISTSAVKQHVAKATAHITRKLREAE